MSDFEAKILKEERIDNPDGSYITKEVAEEGTSCIRYWDKNNSNVKCEFYSDSNFENLEMTSENKFKKDGSYVSKNVYKEPTSDGYQSIIGWYDSKKRNVKTKEFFDNNFKNLIRESSRKYNQDDTFSETVYRYIDNEYLINSYNSEGKIIKSLQYTDKNFSHLFCTYKYTYGDSGDYKREEFYEEQTENEYAYTLGIYNSQGQLIKGQCYSDNSCKELILDIDVLYNEDGSYKQLKKCYKGTFDIYTDNKNVYSEEKWFNKYSQEIYIKSYSDLYFKEPVSEIIIEYLKNGWYKYIVNFFSFQGQSDGQNCEIHIMKNLYQAQSISRYEDKGCKKLISKTTYYYEDNGSYISKTKYYNNIKNSYIIKFLDGITKQVIKYSDNTFKIPIEKETYFYNINAKSSKAVLTENLKENYSIYEEFNQDDEVINTKKCNFIGLLAFINLFPNIMINLLIAIMVLIVFIPVYKNNMPSFFVISHILFFIFLIILIIVSIREFYYK